MQTIVSKPSQETKGDIDKFINSREGKNVRKRGKKKVQNKMVKTTLQMWQS